MFDVVFKRILSLAISLVTLYVPQKEWQEKLDALPSPTERYSRMDLKGWSADSIRSPVTGQMHFYYAMSCRDTASNKTLLLLHGFNTDGAIFFNCAPLAATHTLVAYNFPEKSALYTGSIRDFEAIIDDFCRSKKIDTIDLVGNSMGGIVATFYAAHSRRVVVNRHILVSTYLPGVPERTIRQIQGMADKLLPYPDYKLFYLLSLGSAVTRRVEDGRAGDDVPPGVVIIKQIDWYRQILASLYWYDGRNDARRIPCPVLILHGAKDRVVAPGQMAAAAEYYPNVKTRLFAEAGHSLIYAQADECIREIDAFMR